MDDLFAGAGQGMENITAEDIQSIRCVSSSRSPQLIKTDSVHQGASAGDIFNTVTRQYWEGEGRDDHTVRLRDEVPGVPTA